MSASASASSATASSVSGTHAVAAISHAVGPRTRGRALAAKDANNTKKEIERQACWMMSTCRRVVFPCVFCVFSRQGDIMQDIMALCDLVRQTGFELHRYLGCGHLENVYANGLLHRLR